MAGQYPYNIDIAASEGRDELLSLWSAARLSAGQAAWIMKLTHEEFYALAEERGVPAPSDDSVARHNAELEARIGPMVRQQERERVRRHLSELHENARDLSEKIGRLQALSVANEQQEPTNHYRQAASDSRIAASALSFALAHVDLALKHEGANAVAAVPIIVRSIFNREGVPVWEVENAPVPGALDNTWTFSLDEFLKSKCQLDVVAYVRCCPEGTIHAIPIYQEMTVPEDAPELSWNPQQWAEHVRDKAAKAVAELLAAEMEYYERVAHGEEYGPSSIRVLDGLQPVRKRPDGFITEPDDD